MNPKDGGDVAGATRKLLQTTKVTDKRGPLSFKLALYATDGQKVSDEKLVIADSTSDEPEERIQEVILTISSDVKNTKH